EPSVLGWTAPVAERCIALNVRRDHELFPAPRARRCAREWRPVLRSLGDDGEQPQYRAPGERNALEVVEPERAARPAEIDGDGAIVVRVEPLRLHVPAAAGTRDRRAHASAAPHSGQNLLSRSMRA